MIRGTPTPIQPSSNTVDNAARLPEGTNHERSDLNRLGPTVHPDTVAHHIPDYPTEH